MAVLIPRKPRWCWRESGLDRQRRWFGCRHDRWLEPAGGALAAGSAFRRDASGRAGLRGVCAAYAWQAPGADGDDARAVYAVADGGQVGGERGGEVPLLK